jgi:hypothetical protein
MSTPRIFIASSSEGLAEAQALMQGLQARLGAGQNAGQGAGQGGGQGGGPVAEVRLWPTEFGLSSTYIEALEKQATEADFAVAVFSPDDRITSRARRQRAPRDNVIFELGLFIGALGRPRCFVVHRKGVDLKLPSDLLAVVSADFVQAPGQTLADALAPRCEQMAQRVRELGARRRISPAALVRREQARALAQRVSGDWWERIRGPGHSAISFFHISYDEAQETLALRGRAFDSAGQPSAHWVGLAVELQPERLRLVYRWTGTHPDTPHTQFHGIAELEFDPPVEAAAHPLAPVRRGHGRFWDVDEARPENTHSKAVEMLRETDAAVVAAMLDGTAAQRQALAVHILAGW